jgi:hypothetical protein
VVKKDGRREEFNHRKLLGGLINASTKRDIASSQLEAVVDNPMVLDGEVVSGGNFHGQALAYASDMLASVCADLAAISERRLDRLLDPTRSRGLPAFLTANPGLNSGLMITQYAAAAMVVDLRAAVTDTPHDATRRFVQLPLSPAAIRGYLAPAASPNSHLGPISVYDGSQFILNTYGGVLGYQKVWAFGTKWSNTCFFTPGTTCAANYTYHTAGAGYDTTLVPNGEYQWCVQALTIAGASARQCTPVTIAN